MPGRPSGLRLGACRQEKLKVAWVYERITASSTDDLAVVRHSESRAQGYKSALLNKIGASIARFGLAVHSDEDEQKPSAHALVDDADGEYRYAHESGPRERIVSSDEDGEESEQEEPPVPWPSRIGMEPHKIHVMQASFFRVPEQEAVMKAAAQRATTAGTPKSRLQVDKLLNASARLARKHNRESDMGGEGGMLFDKAEVLIHFHLLIVLSVRPLMKF